MTSGDSDLGGDGGICSDLDKNDDEEIDTKANLHLEIGLLEVSDQQERGSVEDFSR